jgi:hypothetical protein
VVSSQIQSEFWDKTRVNTLTSFALVLSQNPDYFKFADHESAPTNLKEKAMNELLKTLIENLPAIITALSGLIVALATLVATFRKPKNND